MESLGQMRRLIEKVLLALLLGLTAWAAYAQLHSAAARALAARADQTLYVAILTRPAMVASYNPAQKKAALTPVKRAKTPKGTAQNAADVFKTAALAPKQLRYYQPKTQHRDQYWDRFKSVLSSWRYNPLLALRAVWDYAEAYHDKRTNLTPAEFLLYALELTRLEITDFTLRIPPKPARHKRPAAAPAQAREEAEPLPQDRAPLAAEDRPLIVEILNGSGKKGAALELTQFLRDQSQKGLLRVDVLQYDNFPGAIQKETRVVDYSGRLSQVKQLSAAIGVNNEILSEKKDNAICDARVIIGTDFKQPF